MNLKQAPVRPINLKYPLQYASKGAFATNDTTADAIADDLKILLKTNWGERVIQYDFGANLRALLFNPSNDLTQQITDAITAAINKWMPFVNITQLNIVLTENDATIGYNRAQVEIRYTVGKTGIIGVTIVDI